MQADNVADAKQPRSILKSTALKHRASSQGVKFGPTTTIENETEFIVFEDKQPERDVDNLEDQEKMDPEIDFLYGPDDKVDIHVPSLPLANLKDHLNESDNENAVENDERKRDGNMDSDSDSNSSVVHLDDKSTDVGSNEEPAISDIALKDLKQSKRFSAIKAIPKLHLAAGDLRERRLELLAQMKTRRENKTKSPSLSTVPTLESDKKITNFQLSAPKHDSVWFNDNFDLELSNADVREIRTYSNPETSRLVAIQILYQRNSSILAGRLCGHISPGSTVGTLQLRTFEYVVSMTTFRDNVGIAGVALETTESRVVQFGTCDLSKHQAKRMICLQNVASSSVLSFQGFPGCMIALSGSFEFTSIDNLAPVFSAWTRTTFLTVCLLRRLPAEHLADERSLVHKWAEARVLVGFTSSVAPAWVIDAERKECQACNKAFSLWNRRHHCRICGEIFCAKCCNQFRPISTYLPCLDPQEDGEHRLCKECCKRNDAVWKIIREGQ